MTGPFSDDEIALLSEQIDAQLMELHRDGRQAPMKGEDPLTDLPSRQREVVENTVGEDAESFLVRFRDAVKRDLCEPDGLLYKQWERWGDLSNKEVLKTFGAVLAAMGFTGSELQMLVVAVTVVVLHVGLRAFCDR